MKKKYEKPQLEFLSFLADEEISTDGGEVDGLYGNESQGEW